MKLQPNIDLGPIVDALRPFERSHLTQGGERRGFFMSDATSALGGLASASEAITALMLAELLTSSPVLLTGGESSTLYSLVEQQRSQSVAH